MTVDTNEIEQRIETLVRASATIITKGAAKTLLAELRERDLCSLDFETTALDASEGRVRLTVIYDPVDEQVYILDHYFCGPFSELAPYFVGPTWVVYNAKFETRWFDAYVPGQVDIFDVDFLAKATIGGFISSLDRMAYRDLGLRLDKSLQRSDWTKRQLTEGQYQYAATDAVVTWLLFELWRHRAVEAKVSNRAVTTLQDAVRPTIECEDTGMRLDVDYHLVNIERWKRKQEIALRRVRRLTPKHVIDNLNSDKQVSDFLIPQLSKSLLATWPKTDKKGQLKLSRSVIRPIAKRSPYPFSRWLNALSLVRYYNKYLSTYGETLVTKQNLSGKITYRINIAQAATGRASSSSINIQNIPRAPYVRKSFLPPPGFDYLVAADYSGIEIRVLAELSDDDKLRYDAIYGNLHGSMAAEAAHIPEAEFLAELEAGNPKHKAMRSSAKPGTFRITYGAGAGAVADSLNSTLDYAEDFIRKWAARYPKAYNYRNIMYEYMMQHNKLPIIDGRFVWVPKLDRTLPVAANYPIQGAAASVMMSAMHHVKEERDRLATPSLIRLVAPVHDELILACNAPHIELSRTILQTGMEAGWLTVFPGTSIDNLIEIGHGPSWGEAH